MSENNNNNITPASAKSSSAVREEEVLEFWKENKIFEKSLEKEAPKGEYVFYEGPPTANGKPGIHHLEARAFKDAIPRYKTMQGYHVRRKGGWDTHGLPVELQVEKKLELTSKKAIEEYGIAKFNKKCKESVWEYTDLWEKFTDRIGYWVDQENPYVTYHNNYIESVWNVIKKVDEQKLLFKDYKVVPWCPRCGTGLSSHELAQGYEDVKDLSVYVKFKIIGQENTFILAWTTTPWTLPGNVALAVGEDVDYLKIKKEGVYLILAKARLQFIEGEYEIILELKGKDLIGLEYEPLYPYLKNQLEEKNEYVSKAFKIYSADFVTTEDGTGVVHTAVMYGQDDFVLGTEIGLPKHHLVSLDGKFLEGTDFLEGRFVRDEETAVEIIKDLAHRGLLFKKEKYEHSYPHCWRCKTALIYYARDSWYIRMSSLRDELVKENKEINWEPSYIKEGRFGEWLREIKDWAISRERYWGTPLPVWECNSCEKKEVIGGIKDLKAKTKKSGNKYFIMRHGEAENNVIDDSDYRDDNAKLTENGKIQIKESLKKLNLKVDLIISSPLRRTKETTDILCDNIDFPKNQVIYDDRIREWDPSSIFQGKPKVEFKQYYDIDFLDSPFKVLPDSYSFSDLVKRIGDFIYEIENKYQNKKILIISHGCASRAFDFVIKGLTFDSISSKNNPLIMLKNAEIKKLDFTPLPHNENYELDLHRPYVDEVELVCSCGGKLERTKEVMDVWLDSGTMPFSQDHYPFENKEISYPADFISEAIDQTRGWFYTLHAVGVLMSRGKAFKNVICLGHILDSNGKKMSKSLGNVVDPWEMINKYSADTLRLWMYSVNQPGEPKNFDEKTVGELHNKVFNLLYNVLAFYELYRDKEIENSKEEVISKNILDQWIKSRFIELVNTVTSNLDDYKLLEPVRAIRVFIDDLSTWYLRRSRERIKNGDIEAKQTLYYIFKNLAKLIAPFAPFASEDIWQKLKNDKDEESVHLTNWFGNELKIMNEELEVIKEMQKVRDVVTLGLQARQKAGIAVRQPLKELIIKNYRLEMEYQEIIKDELNVKEIKFIEGDELSVEIDTNITEELKTEGQYRELLRAIQDIRKKDGLNPMDLVELNIETNILGQELINKFKEDLMKAVGAKELDFRENDGAEIKINDFVFKVNLIVL
jgi:isoleucyl-tRNA synthetase